MVRIFFMGIMKFFIIQGDKMKYFTKEWYLESKKIGNITETAERKYSSYYKVVKKLIPPELNIALSLHDNRLVKIGYDGNDYYMFFDPTHALSDTTRLVFKNTLILLDEGIYPGMDCIYTEIYPKFCGFELHFLFDSFLNDERILKYFTIQTEKVIYDFVFRNIGKCSKCGKIVSDPTKKNFESRIHKGIFINNIWYCEKCFQLE